MDGYLNALTDAGYEVRHVKGDSRSYSRSDQSTVRTVIYKGKEKVWDQDSKLRSTHGIYYQACIDLGLAKEWEYGECPYAPLDLEVTEQEGRGGDNDLVFKHPSFGLVGFARYTTGPGSPRQFMSPINTHGGISLTVKAAQLLHDLGSGTDRVFGRETLIQLNMSSTQFAELITNPNIGDGIPCTLEYVNGLSISPCELPNYEHRLEANLKEQMDEALAEMREVFNDLEKELKGPGPISAGRKKEIYEKIWRLVRVMDGKPQWFLRQYREHTAKMMVHAKSEFVRFAELHAGRTEGWLEEMLGDLSTKALGGGSEVIDA